MQERSRHLQNMLTSMDIAALVLDGDLRLQWFTERAGEVLHISNTDHGRPLADLTQRLSCDDLLEAAQGVLATMVPVEHEVESDDGRWHLARVLPYHTEEDRTEGVAITLFDVTRMKQTEAAVRESEVRYRTLFSAMDEAYAVVEVLRSADGQWNDVRFLEVNPAFMQQTGMPDPSGRTATEVLGAPDPAWVQLYAQVATTRVPVRVEVGEATLDRVFDLYAFPLGDEGNRVAALFTDITARKETDAATQRMNERLEARVEEHTRRIAVHEVEWVRTEAARLEALRQLVGAEEEERRKISRELHDQLGQQLTGLHLGLRSVMAESDSAVATDRLRALERLAADISQELRGLAMELRPVTLDTLGLVPALRNHLEEWGARHGIEHDFLASGLSGIRIPEEVEITLYRVLQEGLTNVLKHASATRVNVILEHRDEVVRLILEDDGAGFDVDQILSARDRARRLGTRGMRERVALFGGDMHIESTPGAGTTLFVSLPARSREDSAT